MTKKNLFCLYMWAECDSPDGVVTMHGLNQAGVFTHSESRNSRFYSYDELTALLYDLSDITDEDLEICEAISKLMEEHGYGYVDPLDVPEWLREVLGDNGCTSADYVCGYQFDALFQFLRLHHYCTNEEWFKNGWAKRRVRC